MESEFEEALKSLEKNPVSLLTELGTKFKRQPSFAYETIRDQPGGPHKIFWCEAKIELPLQSACGISRYQRIKGKDQAIRKKDAQHKAAGIILRKLFNVEDLDRIRSNKKLPDVLRLQEGVTEEEDSEPEEEEEEEEYVENEVYGAEGAAGPPINIIQELNLLCQKLKLNPPSYEEMFRDGPSHIISFKYKCSIPGTQYSEIVSAQSKKGAKKEAAHRILQQLWQSKLKNDAPPSEKIESDSMILTSLAQSIKSVTGPKKSEEKKKRKNNNKGYFMLSKSLSWLLRHGAPKEKITVYPGGFVDLDVALTHRRLRHYTQEDVLNMVQSNDKQRFAVQVNPLTGKLQIRANQGHSFDVEDLQLTPLLTPADFPPQVIHGTYYKCWEAIKKKGLSRMNRNHIHFAPGLRGENQVISGMRKDVELYIYIDYPKAILGGLLFFKSQNNVILTPGNPNGFLETMYFKKVQDCKTNELLDFPM